jgi:hypothetical protein
MRKIMLTLAATTLVLGAVSLQASAQGQFRGAATLLKNATPIVKLAACNGRRGACGCGAGWVSACGNRCCRCVPC